MKNLKRILLFGCLTIFLLVAIVSTTIFVVLYLQSQSDLRAKTEELNLCKQSANQTCSQTTQVVNNSDKLITFIDKGQKILVKYPNSWNLNLDTNISTDFAYEPIYGRVISKYDLTLTKSDVDLKFVKILGAVGGFPSGFKKANEDFVRIEGSNLVRYSNKGLNDWKYSIEIDCSTLSKELYGEEELNSFEICVNPFFNGFGNVGASMVSIKTADKNLLKEADSIVLSSLN